MAEPGAKKGRGENDSRPRRAAHRVRLAGRWLRNNDQFALLLFAVTIGIAAGYASLVFRFAIGLVQWLALGFGHDRVYQLAELMPWWRLLLATTVGGLVVGLFVRYIMPDRRPLGVADVIEASALHGGRMSVVAGLGAAVANAASIGVGASVGREGPVIHLGASLAAWFADLFRLGRTQRQTLLGCGVAAAIAASFNAPIAGVLFALEVVVGHYALSAFAPVVIASVSGTLISHLYFGSYPAFLLPPHHVVSFWEFPAFALLGVLAAIAAIVFMRGIVISASVAERVPGPVWIRPAIGGLAVGLIALVFPHVLGVGYGATSDVLREMFPLWLMMALVVAKIAATGISLGFGFGGGVFSPSLMVGAMLGGAFGSIATEMFPAYSSGYGAYALVGMGAVAGSVLGAPISTILIIFELSGDYALTIAVMVAVVVASTLTQQLHRRSFFVWQLERRGLNVEGGREANILQDTAVRDVMDPDFDAITPDAGIEEIRRRLITSPNGELFVTTDAGRLEGTITFAEIGEAAFGDAEKDESDLTAAALARKDPPVLLAENDLDTVADRLGAIGEPHIAVVEDKQGMIMIGLVHERDVMLAYQRASVMARSEERGQG